MPRRTRTDPARITKPLRRWYLENRRRLPWRRNASPYRVWISEVMLQQTQVKTVIPYYERFLDRFPNETVLADADEDEVLEYWAGLGYYSRGRNLREAARCIVREHDGCFPDDQEAIRALPGVGEYTSAAIGSIAFGHALPVIDGNVERVLCRYLGLAGDPKAGATRKKLEVAVEEALDREDPGTHNQALMELGALVCSPKNPRCVDCPLRNDCAAFDDGEPERYPTPRKRRKTEEQHWAAAIVECRGDVVVTRSPADSELLAEHWGVPLRRLEGTKPTTSSIARSAASLARGSFAVSPRNGESLGTVKHGITHRKLRIHPVRFAVRGRTLERLSRRANVRICEPGGEDELPALFRKIIAKLRSRLDE